MKPGTLDLLKSKAVINDDSKYIKDIFTNNLPQLVENVNKWNTKDYFLFKTESYKISAEEKIFQVNIALGKSGPLAEFNKNIVFFEVIK